jgi:hypothetical protein
VTAIPAAAISFAVEPVETISTPRVDSSLAKSTKPDLFETEIRARFTFVT